MGKIVCAWKKNSIETDLFELSLKNKWPQVKLSGKRES